MVPTVIEFECKRGESTADRATALADDLGKCRSKCRHLDYTPKVMEIAIIAGDVG